MYRQGLVAVLLLAAPVSANKAPGSQLQGRSDTYHYRRYADSNETVVQWLL